MIYALINECEELNPWQPIETAPKDRSILLFSPDTIRKIVVGHYDSVSLKFKGYAEQYDNPTHWQELPENPK